MCGMNGLDRAAFEAAEAAEAAEAKEAAHGDEPSPDAMIGFLELLEDLRGSIESKPVAEQTIEELLESGRTAFEHSFNAMRQVLDTVGILLGAGVALEENPDDKEAARAISMATRLLKIEYRRARKLIETASAAGDELTARGYEPK